MPRLSDASLANLIARAEIHGGGLPLDHRDLLAEIAPLRAREAYRVHIQECGRCWVYGSNADPRPGECPEGVRLAKAIK